LLLNFYPLPRRKDSISRGNLVSFIVAEVASSVPELFFIVGSVGRRYYRRYYCGRSVCVTSSLTECNLLAVKLADLGSNTSNRHASKLISTADPTPIYQASSNLLVKENHSPAQDKTHILFRLPLLVDVSFSPVVFSV